MVRLRTSVIAGHLAMAVTLAPTACSQAATQGDDVACFTRLRIDVVTQAGAPVVNALVTVSLLNPHGVLLDTGEGATEAAGSYVYERAAPLRGVYPIRVGVAPPTGSGLLPVEVSDSTEYVCETPTTKIIRVTLSPQQDGRVEAGPEPISGELTTRLRPKNGRGRLD